MRKYLKKNGWLVPLIIVMALMIIYSGYVVISFFLFGFDTKPTQIKNGFSKKLVGMLKETYELNIPTDAFFISGYYDNQWQDGAVYITWKVRADEFDTMFLNNWKEDISKTDSEKNENSTKSYKYQKQMYTGLSCSYLDDGYVTVEFQGRHPGDVIR